ncbi:MAG: methylase, partial [Aeromonadales bacterium]|nr:methylase [Aeromonadales bacterium]
ALWIAESQMLDETARIVGHHIDFLPLKTYTSIVEGNALRLDWNSVLPASECSYIMGNPPFIGARMMKQGSEQKIEVEKIFGNIKDVQDLDYVTCWFKKAAEYIKTTKIEVSFVATNSICQGAQVPILWGTLFKDYSININFAYRTFKWENEAVDKAAVHCIIVGFAQFYRSKKKIFDGGSTIIVDKISPYLTPNTLCFVDARKDTITKGIPKMNMGNMARDGGNFFLTANQKDEVIRQEPSIAKWIHPFVGADEIIKGKQRWCFWLEGITPVEIINSKILRSLVEKVKNFRLASSAKTTRNYANSPHLFAQRCQPSTNYLIVPRVSSEKRQYIPIAFMSPDAIASDSSLIVANIEVYHFGVLISSVHMAWMRAVAGRLKSDYRYSKDIVYNNFVWPEVDEAMKQKISKTAQGILDARAKYPEAALGQMYSNLDLFSDLQKAHKANDKDVLEAYGLKSDASESDIVAHLFKLYEEKVREEQSATSDKTAG